VNWKLCLSGRDSTEPTIFAGRRVGVTPLT
jgi:hypothetical protein